MDTPVTRATFDKVAPKIRPKDDVKPEGIYEDLNLLELDPTALTRPTALSAFPPAAHPVSDLKSEISDTLPDSSPRRSAPLEFCDAPSTPTLAAHCPVASAAPPSSYLPPHAVSPSQPPSVSVAHLAARGRLVLRPQPADADLHRRRLVRRGALVLPPTATHLVGRSD